MFQIHVGDTPCSLTEDDYRALAERTEGYSGSDIAIVVRDALMQPVRKVIAATHFKRTKEGKWTPCSHGDPDAVEKSWTDIESDELLEPQLKITDFLKSLESTPPTVNEADVKRHLEWTREAGARIVFFCVFNFNSSSRERWSMILDTLGCMNIGFACIIYRVTMNCDSGNICASRRVLSHHVEMADTAFPETRLQILSFVSATTSLPIMTKGYLMNSLIEKVISSCST